MYRLIITAKAKRGLRQISKIYKQEVIEAINELKEGPFLGKSLRDDLEKKWSYRIDVYRIIYTIHVKDKLVTIIAAEHRSVVYQ